jgi:hypothetical protein
VQDKAANNRAALATSAPLSRFSTSTVFGSKYVVPWLAAQGPLAYSPAAPPAKDYFFQYSWIVPGIFDPNTNLREHRYFGSYLKDSAKFLFDFWASARKGCGAALQQYCEPELFSDIEVKTPLAAYHHVCKYYDTAGSLLIQHGSYQWISHEDQPRIEQGQVLLFLRGRVRGEDHRPKPALSDRSRRLPSGIHPSNGMDNRIIAEISC